MQDNEVVKITHKGKWVIDEQNNIVIDCYVTNDQRRILSLRGTARSMGLKGMGSTALVKNLKRQWIEPYLSDSLKQWLCDVQSDNISKVKGNNGSDFIPFDGELFVDLCKAYINADRDGVFKDLIGNQSEVAKRLLGVMSAFAKVGIVALIDEVTGYQEEREKDELQKILALYIRKEFLPWTKRFPDEFYIEMFRLKGWQYKGNPKPAFAGKLTNWLVYERLPEGVLEELQEKNPVNEQTKKRRHKHHQLLTQETGISHLDKHLAAIITLMRAADDWDDFETLFKKSFGLPFQTNLSLEDDPGLAKGL